MNSALVLAAVIPRVLADPAGNIAHAAGAAVAPASAAGVCTRAVVRSISKDDGKHLHIRWKLIPRAKIPFSMVTYRVLDASLVAGLCEGDSVAFKAEAIDGENVLTAIHAVPPCERFKECR